jgi:CheY-like chemotaxis protein
MSLLVLVVDDSMLIRHTVCRFLEERGFTVQSATNGEDALAAIHRTQPQLIITDIEMPRMNGNELITQLKSQPDTAHIPIVILTSCTKKSAADARADFAIRKDIDINEQLAKVLSNVLNVAATRSATAGR